MGDDVAVYKSGNSTILVSGSEFSGTNTATSATRGAGNDPEGLAQILKAKSSNSPLRFARSDAAGRHPCHGRLQSRMVQSAPWPCPAHQQTPLLTLMEVIMINTTRVLRMRAMS
jgi:hypothetical protein